MSKNVKIIKEKVTTYYFFSYICTEIAQELNFIYFIN